MSERTKRMEQLAKDLLKLPLALIIALEKIVRRFQSPLKHEREEHDLFSECFCEHFGVALRMHHCFSAEPFTKDKFEFAVEQKIIDCGGKAERPGRGNPGYDVIVNGVKVSLKTQGDQTISDDRIHISKFMELGKGIWTDKLKDLEGLRQQFLDHLNQYDRIFILRCLKSGGESMWRYELVEIPKELLQRAESGTLSMKYGSKQSPKPGYCHVEDDDRNPIFELYFDGGTERKLQVKHLLKSACVVIATWEFKREN